jgi:hypothetical protein
MDTRFWFTTISQMTMKKKRVIEERLLPIGFTEALQIVVDLKPRELVLGVDMASGGQVFGVIENADVEMDFIGPSLALKGNWRPAGFAPGSFDPIRGGKFLWSAFNLDVSQRDANIGRDRGAGCFLAVIAVAVAGPTLLRVSGERKGAARASAGQRFGHLGLLVLTSETSWNHRLD